MPQRKRNRSWSLAHSVSLVHGLWLLRKIHAYWGARRTSVRLLVCDASTHLCLPGSFAHSFVSSRGAVVAHAPHSPQNVTPRNSQLSRVQCTTPLPSPSVLTHLAVCVITSDTTCWKNASWKTLSWTHKTCVVVLDAEAAADCRRAC